MKKLVVTSLIAAGMLGLSGCSKSDTAAENGASTVNVAGDEAFAEDNSLTAVDGSDASANLTNDTAGGELSNASDPGNAAGTPGNSL